MRREARLDGESCSTLSRFGRRWERLDTIVVYEIMKIMFYTR